MRYAAIAIQSAFFYGGPFIVVRGIILGRRRGR